MSTPIARAVRHELAHQWWYGIVGDDQYREPWLDEAFATFSEAMISGTAAELCNHVAWPSAEARISLGMDYWARHARDYQAVVYRGGACALQRLGEVIGRARLRTLLRSYADAHRFGWSTTADFIAAADAIAATLQPPVDLTGFWKQHRIG
jgi:aminopeptidase N